MTKENKPPPLDWVTRTDEKVNKIGHKRKLFFVKIGGKERRLTKQMAIRLNCYECCGLSKKEILEGKITYIKDNCSCDCFLRPFILGK